MTYVHSHESRLTCWATMARNEFFYFFVIPSLWKRKLKYLIFLRLNGHFVGVAISAKKKGGVRKPCKRDFFSFSKEKKKRKKEETLKKTGKKSLFAFEFEIIITPL
eukprot:TRINITY_DN8861_c0_g1_i1.p2 TRINITY_DN8861_c0_g1~~TRINITY_DN8861_c0_g1_i1.p2  ORF type:complete len:106 (+),score=0.39 TRINITY_DN8861_c0_g1_i1:182-499(+)